MFIIVAPGKVKHMTVIDKEKIRYYRVEGYGYKAIAAKTGLTESMVKGFCRRNDLTGAAADLADTVCRQCGSALVNCGKRAKKFCCDNCRALWWSSHQYLAEPKTENSRVCIYCENIFYSPPGKQRKYCGHSCYIDSRFGKGKNNDDRTI